MPLHHALLPNGLQIVGETNSAAQVAALGFFVRTGSRDETAGESGVSHFLEHMVFKGTSRRTALEVNHHLDRIGADSNAFTSEEFTVYHAAVLPDYLPELTDILCDILRPSLRGDDFDTEKKVILEEIARYDDMPSFVAYDHARQFYFNGHPLGNSVLGTKASVSALTRDQMLAYFQRRYAPTNLVAAVAGQFDWDRFVASISEKCGHWEGPAAVRDHLSESASPGGLRTVKREGVSHEYLWMICAAPPVESSLRYAASVLALAVGDDDNSRLYWALIDPGTAESASMSYADNQGAGSWFTAINGDPAEASSNWQTALDVFSAVQRDGLTEDELRLAKSKIVSRMVRSHERTKTRMFALGEAWCNHRRFHEVDIELRAYDAVDRRSIRELLDRYPIDHPTTLAFGPLESLT